MTLRSQKRTSKTEASAENGMVTAMHPLAAEAGIEILKRGGNAIDGAIATTLASGVVEPFMSGLGGTLYALVYDASSGDTRSFDGTATAPVEAREDMYELSGCDDPRVGVYGWRATRNDESETFGRPSGIHFDSENGCFRGGMEPYRVGIALGY